MTHYRFVKIIFLILFVVSLLLTIFAGFSVAFPVSVLITFFIVLIAGSIFICSGFYLKSICKPGDKKNAMALTFDDGPYDHTRELLDLLASENIKAAFFVVGKKAEKNPEMVKRMSDEGHIVGNHSYGHSFWFDFFRYKRMKKDILLTNDVIRKLVGRHPRFFRPPYGVTNPTLARCLRDTDFVSVGWSIRTFDKQKDISSVIKRIKDMKSPGGIILLHDTNPDIIDLTNAIIRLLKSENIELKRLDDLIHLNAYEN